MLPEKNEWLILKHRYKRVYTIFLFTFKLYDIISYKNSLQNAINDFCEYQFCMNTNKMLGRNAHPPGVRALYPVPCSLEVRTRFKKCF